MPRFFKRGNQIWKKNFSGEILLINLKKEGHHYDGDSHIFLKSHNPFSQEGATEITEKEWIKARDIHISRLQNF